VKIPRLIRPCGAATAASLVLLCGPPAAAGAEKDLRQHWRIEKLEWQGSIGDLRGLEIVNDLGDVRARLSSDDQVYVSAVVQRHEDDPYQADLRIGERDGRMTLEPAFAAEQSVDPQLLSEGMELRRIDLTVIVPVGAELEVRTVKGLIEAKGLESDVVAASTAGDVVVSILGSLRAETERGAITATFKSTEWSVAPALSTVTGDVSVWLPAGADVTVDAETSGLITTDYSIEIDSEPPPSERKAATARIGGGGHTLTIKSTKGAVRILRSRG
jgi:hypothetical protein